MDSNSERVSEFLREPEHREELFRGRVILDEID
jgi:hypothetical protein